MFYIIIFLEYILDEGEYIFIEKYVIKILIVINIFEIEYCIVIKDELDLNIELLEFDFKEGDNFVKVRYF